MNRRGSAFLIALATAALAPRGTAGIAESKSLLAAAEDGVPAIKASHLGPVVVNKANRAQSTYKTRAAFRFVTGNTLPVEGFENGNVPAGAISGCFSPMNRSSNDPACVDPGDLLPGIEIASVHHPGANGLAMLGAGFAGNPSRTVVASYFTDSENVNLDPVSRGCCWGADFQAYFSGARLTVSLFDPGLVLTRSYTVSTSLAGTFFGIVDDTNEIARVNIFDASGATAEGVDNIEWGWPPISVDVSRATSDRSGLDTRSVRTRIESGVSR